MQVSGTVSAGFENVRQVFADLSEDLNPGGGALAVSHHGELVVNLWCGMARPDTPWQEDTRAVVMSATKGAAALCCALLVDRGLLDPDKTVAQYWPEFAANGKADITVAQLLDHSAGVITFADYENLLLWDGSGWGETSEIQRRLAAAHPEWEPGTVHGYHGLTSGWLWDYLIQHLTGLTTGAFFQQEIAGPLKLDCDIGSSKTVIDQTAHCFEIDMSRLPDEMRDQIQPLMDANGDQSTLTGKAFVARDGEGALHKLAHLMNNPKVLEVEVPAANGTATARSLACMYDALANGGEYLGIQLLGTKTIDLFTRERRNDVDQVLGLPSSRGFGYMLNRAVSPLGNAMGPNIESFGHSGAGGQQAFADPVAGLGFGFVRNALSLNPFHGLALIDSVYKAL